MSAGRTTHKTWPESAKARELTWISLPAFEVENDAVGWEDMDHGTPESRGP